ncbi:DMT family transporter [Gottfriedia acidiceleris]|uniref:DMT family transporter n=1 Tax=Gottfriedia acidiceleris TaxID=371036 RepID=UPI00101DFDBF|nr:DMT family transporter [Gottfriedia acidiceleris]
MTLAYLFLLFVQFLYAIPLVISQVALEQIPIFLFLEISFIAAFVFLLPLALMKEKVNWTNLGKKNIGKLLLQGLLFNVVFNIFLLLGISHTSATDTGIITGTSPALILILSYFLLRERIKLLSILAIFLAITGVVLQSFISLGESPKTSLLGDFFVILAILTQSFFVIFSKKFAADVPPITTATFIMLVGVIFFIPLSIMDAHNFKWDSVLASNWWIDIIYGIPGTALPLILYFYAIRRVPASTVGIFSALLPILTTVTAVLALGEPITIALFVSLCCVVLSIVLAVLVGRNNKSDVSLNRTNNDLNEVKY